MIASFKNEAAIIIDKFNERNFNVWKSKIKILLVSINLWNIVNRSKEAPPSNADPKVKKENHMRVKNTLSIIDLNLAFNQLTHIKSFKGLVRA